MLMIVFDCNGTEIEQLSKSIAAGSPEIDGSLLVYRLSSQVIKLVSKTQSAMMKHIRMSRNVHDEFSCQLLTNNIDAKIGSCLERFFSYISIFFSLWISCCCLQVII